MTVYANEVNMSLKDKEENSSIKLELRKGSNDTIDIKIIIAFDLNDKNNGGILFKNHKVSLILKSSFKPEVLIDIKDMNSINISNRLALENTISLTIKCDASNDERLKKEIIEKLKLNPDVLEKDIHLFSLPIVIPSLPIVGISVNVDFKRSLALSVDATYENYTKILFINSLNIENGNIKPDSSFQMDGDCNSIKFYGKAKAKVGISPNVKMYIINDKIMYLSLNPSIGLYLKLNGSIGLTEKINENMKTDGIIDLEFGAYGDLKIKGYINLIKRDLTVEWILAESKYPIYKFNGIKKSKLREMSKDGMVYGYASVEQDTVGNIIADAYMIQKRI